MTKEKDKKIKIFKEKDSGTDYTFINDGSFTTTTTTTAAATSSSTDSYSLEPSSDLTFDNKSFKDSEIKKIDGKYTKKKKALAKNDISKSSMKGLKFQNPSQRNHSSVYE